MTKEDLIWAAACVIGGCVHIDSPCSVCIGLADALKAEAEKLAPFLPLSARPAAPARLRPSVRINELMTIFRSGTLFATGIAATQRFTAGEYVLAAFLDESFGYSIQRGDGLYDQGAALPTPVCQHLGVMRGLVCPTCQAYVK